MPPELLFAGPGLDRADAVRRDPALLAELARRPDALELMWSGGVPRVDKDGALGWKAVADPALFLGFDGAGAPHFSPVPADIAAAGAPFDILTLLRPADAPIFASALSLARWHVRHGFCSVCGTASAIIAGGWSRRCGGCGGEHFPRVDPVVIMLVEHDGRLLLGRQPIYPPAMYSALAGFVEAGETLERAVEREVMEEAGIAVAEVRYVASQPWPFPSSLMIGCSARALDDRLTIDRAELEDARWFGRDAVAAALAGRPGAGFRVPPPFAIAHLLLIHWLAA